MRTTFDIYNGAVRILQRDDYYAFGLRKAAVGGTNNPANAGYDGKELQDELGQYDYGARFYDPEIGRWNVVDPAAEKFPALSPFSYVANNPILLNDPDGRDWTITLDVDKNGVAHYHILFTGAVVDNTSKKNGRPEELAKAIKEQFEKLFNINVERGENGEAGYTIDARAEINVYSEAQFIGYKETLFNIKDRTDDDFKTKDSKSDILGQAMDGKTISINEKYVDGMISGKNIKTLVHEIGHTAGLKHPAMDYKIYNNHRSRFFAGPTAHLENTSNFMNQGFIKKPTGPTRDQMYRIYRLYNSGKLNRTTNQPVKE